MKIRIYGKVINTWTRMMPLAAGREIEVISQLEIAYKEYSLDDGSLVGEGTEDFSSDRHKRELLYKSVWVWDGKKLNKGGHRWFDLVGDIKFQKSQRKAVKEFLKKKYNAEEIQLRA